MKIAKVIIKSSELRAGNLLMSLNVVGGDRIFPIHGCFIGSLQFDEEKGCNDIDKRWEPIDLTPEILEKSGFLKGRYIYQDSSFNDESFIQKGGRYVITKINIGSLKEPDEYFSMQYFPYPQSQNSIGARLKYLHQLQNLFFALTGEELEIKL